jgi:hypothetical protein
MCKTARALHLAWQQATTPHRAISGAALTTHGGASMFHFTKKRAVAMAVVGSLALSAGAYAYLTGAAGTGSGSATVGSSAQFTVAVANGTGNTALYPDAGSHTLNYDITNPSGGTQRLLRVDASVAKTAGGDIVTGATSAPGCKAEWFTAAVTPIGSVPRDLAAHEVSSGTVRITMQNFDTPQDACQGKSPEITINAS